MTDTAELKPVAWRVKDYADGWIFYTDEKRARIEAEIMSGALVEPLYSADALSSLVRERDEANSDAAIYAKTLMKFRDTLLLVRDGMEDEGDRVYFGSTNDADDLKAIIEKIDALAWDEIMASSQPPVDLYAIIAEQRARATAADADAARMREALEPFAREADARAKLALGPDIDDWPIGGSALTLGDLRRARNAFGGKDE